MSDLFYAAAAVTTLLGLVLIIAYASKHYDDITQAIDNLRGAISANSLRILACFFLISLAVTGLAAAGLI